MLIPIAIPTFLSWSFQKCICNSQQTKSSEIPLNISTGFYSVTSFRVTMDIISPQAELYGKRSRILWDHSLRTLARFQLSMRGKTIFLPATAMPSLRCFATAHHHFVISKPRKVPRNWIAFYWYSFCYVTWFDQRLNLRPCK